ncbi:DUF2975 domain-containing protein [Hymenobacter jejuensis]|uniref:DUF2975 domain-containing protein n=1 Tax=Hymenobacter jejuensis TaxID=2502781 RepID=A0A5B7ZYE1_9BACT|nr:DUF2975 domain-containing protein [Hymenobacter jejuensis]QDA58842.1 DUF2975 domain-containing protein [Hymenobacter jejuensis]
MNRTTVILIKVIRFLILVICVLGAIAAAFYLFINVFDPQQPGDVVTLNVQQPLAGWESQLKATQQHVATGKGAQVVSRAANGTFVYREANAAKRLLLRLMNSSPQPFPYVVATLTMCILIYLILRDIKPGAPFTPVNVRRLRWLGILLIVCDLYSRTSTWWLNKQLAALAPAGSHLTSVSYFNSSLLANWLVGVMLLILAAGYQRGVELAEDAELTV